MADRFVSWDEFHDRTRTVCRILFDRSIKFDSIVAVTRGGLIPAAIVARELNVRLIDTICIIRYIGEEGKQQTDARIIKKPLGDISKPLFIDDVADSGKTMIKIREIYPKAFFVSIFAKPLGKHLVDVFSVEVPQDVWIRFPWDITTTSNYIPPLVGDHE